MEESKYKIMKGNQPRKPKPRQIGEEKQKFKILCLHGYRQNADTFRAKTGSFRKLVKDHAEFIFISAPHIAPPLDDNVPNIKIEATDTDSEENLSNEKSETECNVSIKTNGKETEDKEQRSWWFNKNDGTFKGTNVCGPAYGIEESIRLVEKVWKEQGPFHGLLGFSQGACFVGLLCSLYQRGLINIKPRFAILTSGFKSGSLIHRGYYKNKIKIPSLHIFGENDNIIPKSMSNELSNRFKNSEIHVHSGGHYLPASTIEKPVYQQFFEHRYEDFLCESP